MVTMSKPYMRDYSRRRRISPAQRKKEAAAAKVYRANNPGKIATLSANRRTVFRGLIIQAKDGPCVECSGRFHPSEVWRMTIQGKSHAS